jgi:ElaB/YqjD/DUF883 family membrane-anchored ribosome-binding protein
MEQSDMRAGMQSTDATRDASSPQGNLAGDSSQGIGDRAKDIAGSARDKLADVGSTVRDRAGSMKDSLADAIESGADKLRNRGANMGSGGAMLAGETGGSSVAVSDGRVTQVSDKLAGGMQATANWLRETDLDSVKQSLETQVKEHPGRTLLIAVGVGYLLGKALRK